MRKVICGLVLIGFLSMCGCNTNKPAEEVIDAKDRVKDKVQDVRDDQQKAAEETGEGDKPAE